MKDELDNENNEVKKTKRNIRILVLLAIIIIIIPIFIIIRHPFGIMQLSGYGHHILNFITLNFK